MDIYKNDLNIYLRESDIPQELIYCFKELNDVIVTTANDFKTKFNDKKSKYFFDNYRSTQYLIFDKKEWEMSDKFIDKVRLQLKEIFDRYYRDAKYVYINRIKAETLEETSLYLKDK
jgi:hypothetical protein